MSGFGRVALLALDPGSPGFQAAALAALRWSAPLAPDAELGAKLGHIGARIPENPQLWRSFARACQAHCEPAQIDQIAASLELPPGSPLDFALAMAALGSAQARGMAPPESGRPNRIFSPDPWTRLWPMASRLSPQDLETLVGALGQWSQRCPHRFFAKLRHAWTAQLGAARLGSLARACEACARAFPELLERGQPDFFLLALPTDPLLPQGEARRCAEALLSLGLSPHKLRSFSPHLSAAQELAAWADAWEIELQCAQATPKNSRL